MVSEQRHGGRVVDVVDRMDGNREVGALSCKLAADLVEVAKLATA